MSQRSIFWVVTAAIFVALLAVAIPMFMWWARTSYRLRVMNGMMNLGWGWGLMFLIPLGVLGLIALGVYYFVTGFAANRHGSRRRSLEILDRRYAQGEITREEYLRMREDLERQAAE